MNLVNADIQPEILNAVKQAVYENEVFKMSITNAMGCGQQKGYHENYRGSDIEVNLLKKLLLEIPVNDDFDDKADQTSPESARTGNLVDGKICNIGLAGGVRIRTGETDAVAIG